MEKYEPLINLIKAPYPLFRIYLSKIAARGDVDVSTFNASIGRLPTYWEGQNEECSLNTHDYFYGKNGLPTTRYYSGNGIHLAHSGIKRLLDAVNMSTKIILNFGLFVFVQFKARTQRPSSVQQHTGHQRMNTEKQFKRNQATVQIRSCTFKPAGGFRNSIRQCYGCGMTGHILSECWNTE